MSEKDLEKMKQFLEEKKKKEQHNSPQHPGKTHGQHANTKGFHNTKSGGPISK